MKKFWINFTGINLIGIIVVVNVVWSFLPIFQIDLTKDKLHSVSKVSKTTISNLNDVVNIKVYETTDLPSEIKPIANDLNVILKELEKVNKNKLKVTFLDPSKDEQVKAEAEKYGIKQLQFSSIKSDKFEVQTGYFGLAMFFNDKQSVLPVISDVGNLEYFIVSGIKRLTSPQINKIAIAEEGTSSEIQYLRKYLEQNYEISEAFLDGETPLPETATTLIIAGRTKKINDEGLKKIEAWVNSGKGLIVFLDRISVDQNMKAIKNEETGLEKFLISKGITIEDKLVIDENSTVANFQTNSGNFLVKYNYWPQIVSENINPNLPVMSGITTLNLAWVSPISTGDGVEPLFTSSQNSLVDESLSDLSPSVKNSQSEKQRYVLGAIRTMGDKIAVIGDVDLIKDNFVKNNQQNLLLALNLADYFSQDPDLMLIRAKILKDTPIKQINDQQKSIVRWTNIGATILLLIASYGAATYARKKNIKKWRNLEKT